MWLLLAPRPHVRLQCQTFQEAPPGRQHRPTTPPSARLPVPFCTPLSGRSSSHGSAARGNLAAGRRLQTCSPEHLGGAGKSSAPRSATQPVVPADGHGILLLSPPVRPSCPGATLGRSMPANGSSSRAFTAIRKRSQISVCAHAAHTKPPWHQQHGCWEGASTRRGRAASQPVQRQRCSTAGGGRGQLDLKHVLEHGLERGRAAQLRFQFLQKPGLGERPPELTRVDLGSRKPVLHDQFLAAASSLPLVVLRLNCSTGYFYTRASSADLVTRISAWICSSSVSLGRHMAAGHAAALPLSGGAFSAPDAFNTFCCCSLSGGKAAPSTPGLLSSSTRSWADTSHGTSPTSTLPSEGYGARRINLGAHNPNKPQARDSPKPLLAVKG
ncbi:hypothetical protein Anapl_15355 [Anas platyrhynchos]|uniref:Uncharacterized protein n=1 Tax=Anas platyrhynchos TaxID=8839 RepID=R0K7I5_ANAPL|nr:hypothetical protein Anapl_15355 [Anas platyrhynchos]